MYSQSHGAWDIVDTGEVSDCIKKGLLHLSKRCRKITKGSKPLLVMALAELVKR